MTNVAVTGAAGFVGRALVEALRQDGHRVRRVLRTAAAGRGSEADAVVGEIGPDTEWRDAVAAQEVVVHLAARVHVMRETAADPLAEFRRVNVDGSVRLARMAAAAGVRRLVYVSSIKVNGESTRHRPFRETDTPDPRDAYGRSKFEAELALRAVAERTGLELVVVRPPLVYGPGVKGNFRSLLRIVELGLPLPLARCDNRRSLIALGNLVDLLSHCIVHPAAAGGTFLAADGEDLSTPELIRRIALAFGRPARLFPFPAPALEAVARLIGRSAVHDRLCGSLQVDAGQARRVLDWSPPVTVDAALAQTVAAYRGQAGSPGAERSA